MKTHLMVAGLARRFAMSGALVLAATLAVSGATIAGDAPDQPMDPVVQAALLADHFRCEHQAEMGQAVTIDPVVQADLLADHFRCEHQAEMGQAVTIDPVVQADLLADHFRCEHQAEMADS